jgi:hypothetical protein
MFRLHYIQTGPLQRNNTTTMGVTFIQQWERYKSTQPKFRRRTPACQVAPRHNNYNHNLGPSMVDQLKKPIYGCVVVK